MAQDIDKVEPLIQACLYRNVLADTENVIKQWESSVDSILKTTLGRKIFEFITDNISSIIGIYY